MPDNSMIVRMIYKLANFLLFKRFLEKSLDTVWREKWFPRSRVFHRFFSRLGRYSRQKMWKYSNSGTPWRMLLVCTVGLREQEGIAIRILAESRFRFEGQRGKSLQNEQKGRLMSRCLGHSSRCRGKLFAISDKYRWTFESARKTKRSEMQETRIYSS